MKRRGAWASNKYHGTLEPGPRLMGVCDLCGKRHRWPEMRWKCTKCGREMCALVTPFGGQQCPTCGGRVEAVEEGT
jgi:DNA-directed RNA polymerase subunit RPC12/RpoP